MLVDHLVALLMYLLESLAIQLGPRFEQNGTRLPLAVTRGQQHLHLLSQVVPDLGSELVVEDGHEVLLADDSILIEVEEFTEVLPVVIIP